jgi:hypothetical protein
MLCRPIATLLRKLGYIVGRLDGSGYISKWLDGSLLVTFKTSRFAALTRTASVGENISMRKNGFCILVFSVSCLAALPASAQQDTAARPDKGQPAQPKSSTARSKEKPTLAEATRVSTAEAARKAAAVEAQGHGSEPASQASSAPDVLEFHAASPGAQDSAGAATTKESKTALKSVHGDAYGALGSRGAGKQTGGAVGATSKSGKTSIYVETDRSHDSTPDSH